MTRSQPRWVHLALLGAVTLAVSSCGGTDLSARQDPAVAQESEATSSQSLHRSTTTADLRSEAREEKGTAESASPSRTIRTTVSGAGRVTEKAVAEDNPERVVRSFDIQGSMEIRHTANILDVEVVAHEVKFGLRLREENGRVYLLSRTQGDEEFRIDPPIDIAAGRSERYTLRGPRRDARGVTINPADADLLAPFGRSHSAECQWWGTKETIAAEPSGGESAVFIAGCATGRGYPVHLASTTAFNNSVGTRISTTWWLSVEQSESL